MAANTGTAASSAAGASSVASGSDAVLAGGVAVRTVRVVVRILFLDDLDADCLDDAIGPCLRVELGLSDAAAVLVHAFEAVYVVPHVRHIKRYAAGSFDDERGGALKVDE